jgi:hypothetical protein
LQQLTDLCTWMRANGVRRARVGDLELEFQGTPAPPRDASDDRPKTTEDLAKALHETKRARLSVELGFTPSDEMMARLP